MNGTLTPTERQLIVEINQWRKRHGWFDTNLGWVDPNHTIRIRPQEWGFDLWHRVDGKWQQLEDRYAAFTVRQAVDTLVALDVLPDKFHSIKWAVLKAFAAVDAENAERAK
ncbi:hypothetical protein M2302_000309 [Micromonospora sp. A200]|uniref:hypothetical protein n=1 Tax=Micromonospora sp. A200 TaxID=2940568 RepID=UPI002476F1EE|nr:hypothetical protein [Micromonospora sp. A200]MDH6460158.1 hypothetical protein [Micromonospora sp. A200]